MRHVAFMLVWLMLAMPLAGCLGAEEDAMPVDEGPMAYPDPWERGDLIYDDSDVFSRVTVNGTYGIPEAISVFVQVDTITAADGGAGLTGDAEVHLGLWLPIIEGCDWTLENVSEDCRVPVIADVGPYYDDGDVSAVTPADRLGRFLIENYVPHGYAVAQVSVFGTGESNHCMDLGCRARLLRRRCRAARRCP